MYALIQVGALARVAAALNPAAAWQQVALGIAATCWAGAFALFAIVYAPYLARARIDGKEG
jgi:uncharacterized protein involved in response to NO